MSCVEGVLHVWVGVGHLLLQLLVFTGCDFLSSVSLLEDVDASMGFGVVSEM